MSKINTDMGEGLEEGTIASGNTYLCFLLMCLTPTPSLSQP